MKKSRRWPSVFGSSRMSYLLVDVTQFGERVVQRCNYRGGGKRRSNTHTHTRTHNAHTHTHTHEPDAEAVEHAVVVVGVLRATHCADQHEKQQHAAELPVPSLILVERNEEALHVAALC
jgi:hypothetical protein